MLTVAGRWVVLCDDPGKLAAPRSSTTHRPARMPCAGLMIDRTTVSAIADPVAAAAPIGRPGYG